MGLLGGRSASQHCIRMTCAWYWKCQNDRYSIEKWPESESEGVSMVLPFFTSSSLSHNAAQVKGSQRVVQQAP